MWQNLAGKPLTPPFVGDQAGGTTEVTERWERPCTTWLTAFAVTSQKAHFVYLAAPNRSIRGCPLLRHEMRYQRFDLDTGLRDVIKTTSPYGGVVFDNPGGHFLNGFLATSPLAGALFLTSQTSDNRLAIVASTDEGASWRLVSQTERLDDHIYGIGGQRLVTSDGRVVGSFTHDSLRQGREPSVVRFFQADIEELSAHQWPSGPGSLRPGNTNTPADRAR